MTRPESSEFDAYYGAYVAQVPEGDIVTILAEQAGVALARFRAISEDRAGKPYTPGKWTVKETAVHLTDAERIFSYRALRIARQDTTPLPGFEQNDYAATCGANERAWSDILDEMATVRAATLSLFRGLRKQAWSQEGTASGCAVTVRALAYIIAGHMNHHLRILREHGL